MPEKQIALPNGRVRRMQYRAPMMIDIVSPAYKNGTPVTPRDIISAPVRRSGEWNLGDMLNQDSIGALFLAFTRAEEAITKPLAAKRAPARKASTSKA